MNAFLLLAQEAAKKPAGQTLDGILNAVAVPLLLLAVLWFMFARLRAKSKPLQDRSLNHMNAIEAKTDEMIRLLKEIRDRVGRD